MQLYGNTDLLVIYKNITIPNNMKNNLCWYLYKIYSKLKKVEIENNEYSL